MATNLQIKFIKSLQLKKNRQEFKQFLCEGDKMVRELVHYRNESIIHLFATEKWVKDNNFEHPKLQLASAVDMERMTGLSGSPPILAQVKYFDILDFDVKNRLNIYLDNIADPGNMGTILRTCEWYGIRTVFTSLNSVDIYNPKVVQASMGSIFRIQIVPIDFQQLYSLHPFSQIIAAVMNGVDLHNHTLDDSSLLIMGSESHGVSAEILSLCTDLITIPNHGRGDSLNVSVATGIILNEFLGK